VTATPNSERKTKKTAMTPMDNDNGGKRQGQRNRNTSRASEPGQYTPITTAKTKKQTKQQHTDKLM
jgi:hypothetical protein